MSGKFGSFVFGVLSGVYIKSEYPSEVAFVVPEIKKNIKKIRVFFEQLEEESRKNSDN
tara:strand:+ start:326 stop:499 length:174 start_codon:yes stop_codon:yes gene_type:complete